jgi:DNA-binding MarR family transcriptional regulator
MTDVIVPAQRRTNRAETASPTTAEGASPAPDARLVTIVELLFFAYRDFTGEADAILAELGLGRAHHRVLHFVNRNPGLRVADLLDILKITKQSLARVLKQLVDGGHIVQAAGQSDRRERRLALTPSGQALAARLLELQTKRIAKALATADSTDDAIRRFLFAMVGPDRRDVAALLGASAPAP